MNNSKGNTMTELSDFTLPRTGQTPVAFTGKLLLDFKSPAYRRHEASPEAKAHWFECSIYQTKGKKIVVHIAYRFAGNLFRETNQDFVEVVDYIGQVMEVLNNFEPTQCVAGYPDGEYWEKKQKRLMDDIDGDWDLLCEQAESAILATFEPERID